MTCSYVVEVDHDGETHTAERSFGMAKAAACWAGLTVADLFRDAHVLDRDTAAALLDRLAELDDVDLPVTITEPSIDVVIRLERGGELVGNLNGRPVYAGTPEEAALRRRSAHRLAQLQQTLPPGDWAAVESGQRQER